MASVKAAKAKGPKAKSRAKSSLRSQKSKNTKIADNKKSSKASAPSDDPLFRPIFLRPERHQYVRHQDHKNRTESDCVFCSAAKGPANVETLKVWQTSHAIVVLNKFPYNTGHLLILPQRHVGEMEDLSDIEASELMIVLRTSVRILKEVYKCQGLNVGMNLGAVAGAGIPGHLHIHVVPRWAGDTNFFPLLAQTKVMIERLEDTFTRLLPLFQREKVL